MRRWRFIGNTFFAPALFSLIGASAALHAADSVPLERIANWGGHVADVISDGNVVYVASGQRLPDERGSVWVPHPFQGWGTDGCRVPHPFQG